MLQYDFSDKRLRTLASNQNVFQQGIAYATTKKVSNFNFDQLKGLLTATVTDSRPYGVQVIFNLDGAMRVSFCTCSAFKYNSGACKHIVAVLKTAQYKMNENRPNPDIHNRAIDEMLASFTSPNQENPQESLTLEVELHIATGQRHAVYVQLKIGSQRLYVVKDIGQLLSSVRTGRPLEFGKQFTFEPSRHRFQGEDQAIISMLQEMFAQYAALKEIDQNGFSSTLFSQKIIPLSSYYLKKLLDNIGNKTFMLEIGYIPPMPVNIVRTGLSLTFSLQAKDQDLALNMESDNLPVQLTTDGSYYYYRNNVYLATPAQKEFLPPLLKAYRKSNNIIVSASRRERFASEALPLIKKAGQVMIDSTLAEKFNQEPLQAKIYFDRSNSNGIKARLEFHYGEMTINPFAANQENSSTKAVDVILIRSIEQERKILNILEQADFIVSQGQIYLDDDEKLYEFTLDWIPQLQDLAEIYYSDQFKLKIHSFTGLSGRVRLDENLDLLEISFAYSDIDQAELKDIFQSLHLKKKYYRLRDGSFLDLNQPELITVAQLLDNLNLKAEDFNKQIIHLPKFRAMYIDSFLRQANMPGLQRNKAFKQLVQNILEPQDGEFEIPSELNDVLRDYQKTGFKWLKTLAAFGLGGILADDMGLGKTLQVLTFIVSELPATPELENSHAPVSHDPHTTHAHAPALVIAPTSLIYNWQEEAKKFTPNLRVLVVDGTPSERQSQLASPAQWDLVVTSYPILRRDIDTFTKLEFSYCFLDEAQHIKNPQTLNAKSVQQLQAKGYFALTGTPIENSLSELWSIFNFIMPGYLLSQHEFRQKFEIPIVKSADPKPLAELSRHVNPFILRRLKKDVLKELPDKIETQIRASLTDEQKKIYLAFLHEAQKQIAQEIAAVGFEKSQIKILAALTRLRQISCHPGMFIDNYTGDSGKMQLFQEILADALDGDHRILVFSQFTSMLDIIQNHLFAEKIEHFYLNGSTKAADRIRMAQAFNNGEGHVFLISLKAGGTGLNLTGADTVIHYDPWWNPAVEDQATDRAYRIGQKKAVQVIKLITQGTVEEKVNLLQAKKKELITTVIQPGETMISKLSEVELRELFEIT